MAMMGSAKAAGPDRARLAAEQAVACPLLEDIHIADARGVLVNISASKATLQLQEIYDIMEVIKACASDTVSPIIGAVYEDQLEDDVRVTIVATGLGKGAVRQQAEAAYRGRRARPAPTTSRWKSITARSKCRR